MDEIIKKRIQNTIKQLEVSGKKVINTKYFPSFIQQEGFKLSQAEIEDYLLKENYISISDDYMVFKPDFIKYCIKNNLNNINKLKKHIFNDYNVPYITLSETQLLNLIKQNNYYIEKPYRKNIIAEHKGIKYIIKNKKDLLDFGLQKTFISYDLLEDFCNVHSEEDRFELVYKLQDRDIKLLSEKIDYFIEGRDEEEKEVEDEGVIYLVESNKEELDILSPKEIISFLKVLAKEDKQKYDKNEFYMKYSYSSYSYLKKIINTGVLKESNDILFVSPNTLTLVNKIKDKKNKNGIYTGIINTQEFINENSELIVSILLQNNTLSKIIKVLKKANEENISTMQGIATYCHNNNLENFFINTFIGKKSTNGIKPLKEYTDVCFFCDNIDRCIGKRVKDKSNLYISEILLKIRNKYSKQCLRSISYESNIDILLKKPIYLKFLVSYKLVVETKMLLKKYKVIEDCNILYKYDGKYCPQNDIWRVKSDILV